MNKYHLSSVLRKLGLIKIADKTRFYFKLAATYKKRRQFFSENPGINLPPAYYIYETFNLNYFSFYNKSIETAKWLISYFEKYKKLDNIRILDWGCGPGRVIRHLPDYISDSCKFFGTDYNKKYVTWCSKNIHGMDFRVNKLQPPLSFEEDFFDIIYGISIFTHLSEEMHFAWFKEIQRVAKEGCIILLTLHGETFKSKLTNSEQHIFDQGKLVIKAKTKEGHRTFGAFHPPRFVQQLVGKNEILEHIPGITKEGKPQQDVWIIRVVKSL